MRLGFYNGREPKAYATANIHGQDRWSGQAQAVKRTEDPAGKKSRETRKPEGTGVLRETEPAIGGTCRQGVVVPTVGPS